MLVRDGSVDRTCPVGPRAGETAMKQQAELAPADLPVAPSPLRLVAARGARLAELAPPAPVQAPTIRTLFPAIHHVQPDRSAAARALALWAAPGRAADLGRRNAASNL